MNLADDTVHPDVAIVGGGIAGCLTGYLLARQGAAVTILEADSVGSHASGFAFGGLGPLEGSGIPEPLLDFSVWCFQRHAAIHQELREETGIDTWFRRQDRLTLAFTGEEAAQQQQQIVWQNRVPGFQAEWLEPAEVVRVEPRANPDCLGAAWVRGAGAVDAYRCNLAAAQAAEKYGAALLQRRATGLLREGDRCVGLQLESGTLPAGAVVLAGGPWAGGMSSWCGVNIPVRPLKGQIIRLRLSRNPLTASLNYRGSYAAVKPDGLIWAGTTEEEAGFAAEPTSAGRDKVMRDLLTMAPSLAEAELVQQTACLRPLSADGMPIAGAVSGWQNLYLAAGGGRKGILWSAGMAHGLAELMQQGATQVPGFAELSLTRFSH